MRNCALWITPWVARDTEIVMDTAALTDAEWRAAVHNDPDVPPKDTVLLLIHPARHMDLKAAVTEMNPLTFMDFADVNGSNMARYLITKRCHSDSELAHRLRWW